MPKKNELSHLRERERERRARGRAEKERVSEDE
jgi:hypothetical protein